MISEECKAYEKFALGAWQDPPFPMAKNKLLRYIKMRARCGTFANFMTNLDKHPLHGPHWLQKMNRDPDVRKLMQLSCNLWPRQTKECREPLIGIGYVNKRFINKWTEAVKEDEKKLDNVRVVQGPKAKGFMVTDDSIQDSLLNLTPTQPLTMNTTSQLSSRTLYMPSPNNRITERLYEDEGYNVDELEVIDAKQLNDAVTTTVDDPYEEGSSSSMSSKKNSKQEEDDYDFGFDYSELNDFDLDLGNDFQKPLDEVKDIDNKDETTGMSIVNGIMEMEDLAGMDDMDMGDIDMDEINYVCNVMSMDVDKGLNQPIDDAIIEEQEEEEEDITSEEEEEDYGDLEALIKEPKININVLKPVRGRPRKYPIGYKKPSAGHGRPGWPRKPIPEPKVVIKATRVSKKEKQVEDLTIFDFQG